MRQRLDTLTITLHWRLPTGEQTTTVVCEDSSPAQLLPLLLAGCGLPATAAEAGVQPYTLRLGAPNGRPLQYDEPVSAGGVRSGSHIWISDRHILKRRYCLLMFPDGCAVALPRLGADLTRTWLFQLLAILSPGAHAHELELLEQGCSPFRYVSNRVHCSIRPGGGRWAVSTDRADVATLLNTIRLCPGAPEILRDGDRLKLGDGGPTLVVCLADGLEHQ